MRALLAVIAGVLVALICAGIGFSIGRGVGYSAGYSKGTHDVCTHLLSDEQQLMNTLANTPDIDPRVSHLVLTTVTTMHTDACGR